METFWSWHPPGAIWSHCLSWRRTASIYARPNSILLSAVMGKKLSGLKENQAGNEERNYRAEIVPNSLSGAPRNAINQWRRAHKRCTPCRLKSPQNQACSKLLLAAAYSLLTYCLIIGVCQYFRSKDYL